MKLGDLFAKLAAGDSLSAPEIETLRLGMNQQQIEAMFCDTAAELVGRVRNAG